MVSCTSIGTGFDEQTHRPDRGNQQEAIPSQDGGKRDAQEATGERRVEHGQEASSQEPRQDEHSPQEEGVRAEPTPQETEVERVAERSEERAAPKPCSTKPSVPLNLVNQWQKLVSGRGPHSGNLIACGVQGFRMVGAATSEYEVHVKGFPAAADLRLTVYNAKRANKVAQDKPLTQAASQGKGWLVGRFTIDQSGEISLVVDALTYPRSVSYSIEVFCTRNCQLEATRYPIVLMHGFAGTDKYFGILTYFYQVKSHLTRSGYSVFTPTVQPIASSALRVKTLKQKIDDIFQKTGARKLNLIAHSQGGVDGRLLIASHKYGDRIASLTTISTPHRGVPVPNLLIQPSKELGEANMKKYNQTYPNDKRVAYFSWAGVSCNLLDTKCRKKHNNEVVDVFLIASYTTLKALRGDNDGVVPVSSAKWGTFLGFLPADHFDEVGQIADNNNKSFQHKTFYLNEAKRLRKLDF